MNKTPQEWSKVSAEAVTGGSVAQATNVLQMALDDIATLATFQATVDRIWKALGIETYEQANGKEISEIIADLRSRSHPRTTPVLTGQQGDETMTNEQIKHMVSRFLMWKLPENFRPDGGVSFAPSFNDEPMRGRHWPVGTNILDANQAEAMVRHMVDEMGDSSAVAFRVKDYADGWAFFVDESQAREMAEAMGGALIQGLCVKP